MNFQQILIRMGVDAKAVVTGLNRTSSVIKGWSASMAGYMRSSFGKLFAAGFAIEALRKLKDQVIEVRNLSQVTGLSTNFIQSLMFESAKAGVSINSMVEPLKNFNNLIGQAKMGVPDAIVKLHDLGIISKQSEINSLNEADALKKLADRYKEFGDSAKRAYYLEKAGFSGNAAISNILSNGSRGIEGMELFNPFKQLSKGTISDVSNIWTGIKVGAVGTLNFLGNTLDTIIALPIRKASQFWGALGWWCKIRKGNSGFDVKGRAGKKIRHG